MATFSGKWLPCILGPGVRDRVDEAGVRGVAEEVAPCLWSRIVAHTGADGSELWGNHDNDFLALRMHVDTSFRRAVAQQRVVAFYATDTRVAAVAAAGPPPSFQPGPPTPGPPTPGPPAPGPPAPGLTDVSAAGAVRSSHGGSSSSAVGTSLPVIDVSPGLLPLRRLGGDALPHIDFMASAGAAQQVDAMDISLGVRTRVEPCAEADDDDDEAEEEDGRVLGGGMESRAKLGHAALRGRMLMGPARRRVTSEVSVSNTQATAESFRSQQSLESASSMQSVISSAEGGRAPPGSEGGTTLEHLVAPAPAALSPSLAPLSSACALSGGSGEHGRADHGRASPSPSPSEGSHTSGTSSRTRTRYSGTDVSMGVNTLRSAASAVEYAGAFPVPRVLVWNLGLVDDAGHRMFAMIARKDGAPIAAGIPLLPALASAGTVSKRPSLPRQRLDAGSGEGLSPLTTDSAADARRLRTATSSAHQGSGNPPTVHDPELSSDAYPQVPAHVLAHESGPTDVADAGHAILATLNEVSDRWDATEWSVRWVASDVELGDRKHTLWAGVRATLAASLPAHQLSSAPPRAGAALTPLHASLRALNLPPGLATTYASAPPPPAALPPLIEPLPRSHQPDAPLYHAHPAELVYDPSFAIIPRYSEMVSHNGRDEALLRSVLVPDVGTRALTRQQIGQRLRTGVEWALTRATADPRSVVSRYDPVERRCGLVLPLPLDLVPESSIAGRANGWPTVHVAAGMFFNAENGVYEMSSVLPLSTAHIQARFIGKVHQPWLKGLSRLGPTFAPALAADGTLMLSFNASGAAQPPCLPFVLVAPPGHPESSSALNYSTSTAVAPKRGSDVTSGRAAVSTTTPPGSSSMHGRMIPSAGYAPMMQPAGARAYANSPSPPVPAPTPYGAHSGTFGMDVRLPARYVHASRAEAHDPRAFYAPPPHDARSGSGVFGRHVRPLEREEHATQGYMARRGMGMSTSPEEFYPSGYALHAAAPAARDAPPPTNTYFARSDARGSPITLRSSHSAPVPRSGTLAPMHGRLPMTLSPVLLTGAFDGWRPAPGAVGHGAVRVDTTTPNFRHVAASVGVDIPDALLVNPADEASVVTLRNLERGAPVVFCLAHDPTTHFLTATQVEPQLPPYMPESAPQQHDDSILTRLDDSFYTRLPLDALGNAPDSSASFHTPPHRGPSSSRLSPWPTVPGPAPAPRGSPPTAVDWPTGDTDVHDMWRQSIDTLLGDT